MGFANHKASFFYLRHKAHSFAAQIEETQTTIDALVRALAAKRAEQEVFSTAEFVEAIPNLLPRISGGSVARAALGHVDSADEEEAMTLLMLLVA